MTFAELQAAVYTELKEGSVSSPPENYPLATVKNLLNEGYYDAFNQPNTPLYLREGFYTFQSAADTTASSAITAGDATISVASTTNFATSGKVLIDDVDIVTYTGTTATSLTGCTGTSVSHASGVKVRYLYALPSGIDDQKISYLKDANTNREFLYVPWEEFLTSRYSAWSYSIVDGRVILPVGTSSVKMMLGYFQDITEMSSDSDTPSLIPTKFQKLLVFYVVGRLLNQEEDTRGLLYYNVDAQGVLGKPGRGLYFDWLHKFYARYSKRTGIKNVRIPFRYVAR